MNFSRATDRNTVFAKTEAFITEKKMDIIAKDDARPWGGFLVIDENDRKKFIAAFFPQLTKEQLSVSGKLSPKILIVAPGKRLSWQYHHRRAEIWKLIGGEAAVTTSDTDEEWDTVTLKEGNITELKQGERHRLIGLDEWGIVAEIWIHTDPNHPSDEEDIVRVQDDFGRSK